MNLTNTASQYAVLTRLFEMVKSLTEDQQVLLLKQFDGNALTSHLFKLIIDLSEDEQVHLLDRITGMLSEEVPEKTIELDERESPRRICTIDVNFETQGHSFKDTIKDISAAGVFIKTEESLEVGQGISLRFSFPGGEADLDIQGEIVWRRPHGIGVKFYGLTPQHFDRIKHFVDQP